MRKQNETLITDLHKTNE